MAEIETEEQPQRLCGKCGVTPVTPPIQILCPACKAMLEAAAATYWDDHEIVKTRTVAKVVRKTRPGTR